jgi:hypothetical protein
MDTLNILRKANRAAWKRALLRMGLISVGAITPFLLALIFLGFLEC